jgi:hypothetical protein
VCKPFTWKRGTYMWAGDAEDVEEAKQFCKKLRITSDIAVMTVVNGSLCVILKRDVDFGADGFPIDNNNNKLL